MKPLLPLLACAMAALFSGCGGGGDGNGAPAGSAASQHNSVTPGRPDGGKATAADWETLSREVAELRERVARLELAVRRRSGTGAQDADPTALPTPIEPGPDPVKSPASPKTGQPPPPPATAQADPAQPPLPQIPIKGLAISQEQRDRLMADELAFNPGSIPSSGTPVAEDTPLRQGQDLQVKYGGSWWAAVITGFEEDGGVRIRYFGWGSYPEEIVPRSDLQLDDDVRQKAVGRAYGPPP